MTDLEWEKLPVRFVSKQQFSEEIYSGLYKRNEFGNLVFLYPLSGGIIDRIEDINAGYVIDHGNGLYTRIACNC